MLATVRDAMAATLVTVEASAEAASSKTVAFMHTGLHQGAEMRGGRRDAHREVKERRETRRVES